MSNARKELAVKAIAAAEADLMEKAIEKHKKHLQSLIIKRDKLTRDLERVGKELEEIGGLSSSEIYKHYAGADILYE